MKIKSGFAAFVCALTLFGQALLAQSATPVPPALDKPALERYFRHLLMWPNGIDVALGEPTPAPLQGFYRMTVRGSSGSQSYEYVFYVSADGRKVIRGDVYDVGDNPFQADIDLLKTDDQPFLGMPGAPVTIVEFADFQCPYCKQESAVLRTQLMQAYPNDVQLYFVDYPIEGHPFARGAAILGRCTYHQNAASFWAYHDWIFAHQSEITPENLRTKALEYAATDKNLDVGGLTACAVAPEPRAEVDRTVAMGDALKIGATPTFFINGRRMVGAIPLENLKLVIDHEIEWEKNSRKSVDCCSVQLALPGAGAGPAVTRPGAK